ncbi:transposase, partial [Pseudomonas frederiksbergensis]|nr:transposase [Pseudomonas frederiksbergensis]
MDSKLISSNIAWYSRYEIIQKTFAGSVTRGELESIDDQMIRQQALEFFDEDAAKTVYRTDSETMGHRLL